MSRTRVVFNGHELTRHFVVSDLRNRLLPRNIETRKVPGMDGAMFAGVTLGTRVINMTLTAIANTMEERAEATRTLAKILSVDEPAPLMLSIDGGNYYLAMPNSDVEGIIYQNATSYDVSFHALDPVAYGAERLVTVPSGGSVSFRVDGTYRTTPRIEAPSAANGSLGYWRVALDDGSYVMATIPSGVSTAEVVADCGKRTLKVNGSTTLLAPAADWIGLEPGTHTLTMHGTGAATVTFRERWL